MNDLEAQKKKDADLALIREFAGQALAGCLSDSDFNADGKSAAKIVFNYADDMLAEYKKRYGVE